MNLLFEIATAVLDYLSSQQRQPRYALSGKEEVSWQRKGWIPWFYHPAPSKKLFGNPVQVLELFFSVSQCVSAIIAYHYLSRDQNNPAQFSVYPIAFAFSARGGGDELGLHFASCSWKFDSNKIRDLKRSGESLFTTGKPTSVELRMDTTSSTQNWISELTKTWTTWKGALPRWLEVIDPRHRVGRNLNFYFQKWMTSSGGQPFFYWLDVGDGKTVNHPECSREKLRQERNTYLELVSKSKVAESIMSLVLRSVSNTEKDINNNQREHGRADGFNQQASNSEAVESPASFVPRRQRSSTILRVEDEINNNQRAHNGPADGFNQKDLLRRIFYTMNLLFEIATAVLDYLSSQQRQPRVKWYDTVNNRHGHLLD
ncbi:hypothetical protein POTOM_049778 [Populus tomentosa]|uniref:Uncharacterized protein n=1 Tax=Populus tomentosa TaxID=118781 RepID=A0A8X7YAP2_POPTO|nr:hypothetical protein POTOM_049778 [Populus tomentosa]